MKLKDLLFISTSALVMGAFAPSAVTLHHAFGTPNIVHAQELTEAELESAAQIKDQLAGLEPVNLEQLLTVSDQDLLTFFETAQTQDPSNQWQLVYDQVAANYPALNLLTGEDYEAYLRAAEAISANSAEYNYTFSDLNTALPRDILSWYQAAMTENEEDVIATVEQILPQITAARDAYIVRRTAREDEAAQESETSEESEVEETSEVPEVEIPEESSEESEALTDLDKLKESLVNHTYITAEGLESMDDAVLESYLGLAVESNFDEASALIVRDSLVSEFPELFTEEQVQEVLNTIRQGTINDTPMLPEQAELIPADALHRYAQEMNTTTSGYELIYNKAIEEYPEVFEAEAQRFRDLVAEESNLNVEDLAALNDEDILWEEYGVFLQNDNAEDMETLAKIFVEKYGVQVNEDESDESEDSDLVGFKEALISQTSITAEQLDAIGEEALTSLASENGFELADTSVSNLTSFEYVLITYYQDNFTDDQITMVANRMRETAVSASPMTMDIANQIPSGEFLAWTRDAAETGGNDITYPFQRAVAEYSSLFNDLVVQAKNDLMEQTNLTQEVLDQMEYEDLLFATYAAEGEPVDYAAAEVRLRETYPALFEPASSETETESDVESESESTSESTSVSVSKSTDVESQETTGDELPNTGESNPFWLISLSLILLAGAGFLIYRGGKKNKNNEDVN